MTTNLKAVETAFYAAMQSNDAEAMGRLMAPDCVYIHSFGNRDSKDTYLDRVRNGFFVYHRIDFTQDRILERGDVVIIVGTMSGTVTAGGVERRLNNVRTSVWSREKDRWKLALFQPTPWLDR
jgi:uncharacterized protein (TIGR02246 family)